MALALAAESTAWTDLLSKAAAATPDPEHGRVLYLKHCVACHRSRAWGDGPREIPALAGQRQRYLLEELAFFATGQRAGSLMHGPAMQETLQQPDLNRAQAMADLAAYLSQAPRNPEPEHSEGRAHAAGKRLYAQSCSACHGPDGAGSEGGAEPVPGIGGQHYGYVLTQLRSFASGRRDHPPFAQSSGGLSADEQEALADYVSRLTPGAARSP